MCVMSQRITEIINTQEDAEKKLLKLAIYKTATVPVVDT